MVRNGTRNSLSILENWFLNRFPLGVEVTEPGPVHSFVITLSNCHDSDEVSSSLLVLRDETHYGYHLVSTYPAELDHYHSQTDGHFFPPSSAHALGFFSCPGSQQWLFSEGAQMGESKVREGQRSDDTTAGRRLGRRQGWKWGRSWKLPTCFQIFYIVGHFITNSW